MQKRTLKTARDREVTIAKWWAWFTVLNKSYPDRKSRFIKNVEADLEPLSYEPRSLVTGVVYQTWIWHLIEADINMWRRFR